MKWKGVLIVESLQDDQGIWDRVAVTGESKRRLEQEGSRGEFTFCNVEVSDRGIDSLMREVAKRLRSPGWYFHVERDRAIKVAYPGKVMEMSGDDPGSIQAAREYMISSDTPSGRLRRLKCSNWSTVNARMSNIRWHSTLLCPRTRT